MHKPPSTVAIEIVRWMDMRRKIARSIAVTSTNVIVAIASRANCVSSRATNRATITINGTQAIASLEGALGAREVRSAKTRVTPSIATENARSTKPSLSTAIAISETTMRTSSTP